MQVSVHWIRPEGTTPPTKEEIVEFCNTNLGFNWKINDIAKLIRNAVITQEEGFPQRFIYVIDHEETEDDPEHGIENLYTRNSVIVL